MSVDAKVTNELIETLQDGEEGFVQLADKLDDSDSPELVSSMRRFSEQRAGFRVGLEALAKDYGDDVEASGTTAAAIHRGWIGLKDALTGSSPKGVLKAAQHLQHGANMVVLSNYATPDMRRKCLALGAAHVFDKSTEIEALIDYCVALAQH